PSHVYAHYLYLIPFFSTHPPPTAFYTLSLHDALPISGDFDGTKPLICSLIQVVVCERTGEVERETAEGVNLPQFFFIDVAKKNRSEEHTSELQSLRHLVCRLLLEKKKKKTKTSMSEIG